MPTTIDAVLPLAPHDYRRAALCVRSLAHFFPGLGTLWIVYPESAGKDFERWSSSYPFVRSVSEEELLSSGPGRPILHRVADVVRPGVAGWYRQQVVKLAFGQRATTPFYLALDAGVICTQPIVADELFVDGAALTVCHEMCHPVWYRTAARLLREPMLDCEFGVTPALLHTDSVRGLIAELSGTERNGRSGRWLSRLGRSIGWTEYALYYTFLEARGRLEHLHHRVAYSRWFGPSVWGNVRRSWSAQNAFDARSGGWFCVVSARFPLSIAELEEAVMPYLEPETSPRR